MKIENQERIWDAISDLWKTFRSTPVPEAAEFLRTRKGKILDLGCGSGRNFVKTEGVIYGVDFSKNQLKFAGQFAKEEKLKVKLFKTTADSLPFQNDFFDSAIFINALHCIAGKKKRENSLRELFRVMKPGAEAMIMVWNKNQERFRNEKKDLVIHWKRDGVPYPRYYYLYDEKELLKLLEKVGFRIVRRWSIEKPEGNSKRNIIVLVRKL